MLLAMASQTEFVIGADGCAGASGEAWAAVRLFADGRCEGLHFDTTESLWATCSAARMILLDVPIGLPHTGGRAADAIARTMIGPRRSSVFPAPERWLLDCPNLRAADREKTRRAGCAAKVQRQMWNIVPRIRAVDELLRREPRARGVIREAHPEVCAAVLSGRFLEHSKKTSDGQRERRETCERYVPTVSHVIRTLRGFAGVSMDDAIDAVLCAVTAAGVWTNPSSIRTIPEVPPHDACGVSMEMVYRVP